MPRKGFIAKRDVLPDPMYNSKVVTKLINNVMEDGKKGVAQKICYEAFEIMAQKTGKDALEVFEEAMNNVMPLLEVKARRILHGEERIGGFGLQGLVHSGGRAARLGGKGMIPAWCW